MTRQHANFCLAHNQYAECEVVNVEWPESSAKGQFKGD